MTGTIRAEVAVIGLGAMGAAVLHQLARRGMQAVGIDRYAPPHTMGSTHGETRITRVAVGEGDAYVPFVTRSHAIWRELEARTGETLLQQCGLLIMAPGGVRAGHHGRPDFLGRTVAVAERHGIAHERLDAVGIAARFPVFGLRGDEEGYFEPGGGFVHPERCIAAQLRLAAVDGASVLTGRRVLAVQQRGGSVQIDTDAGVVQAGQAVVAAGAWAGALLGGGFGGTLVPYRQVLHWVPVDDPSACTPDRCPAYIWMQGPQAEDYFYGFPALPGAGEVKVGTEQYVTPCHPDAVDRTVSAGEAAAMHAAHVAGRLRGAGPAPARSATCLYTMTPDANFVIDRHPAQDRVVVVSACSGHGFKHSAGIGEAVAQLVCDGRSGVDLQPFRLARLLEGEAA